jgi:hypothetical protein
MAIKEVIALEGVEQVEAALAGAKRSQRGTLEDEAPREDQKHNYRHG